ncbi:MAG TPA: head GIN domain-containing protein [Novosphingobium sp.]|nr:head GIN domain-containing protein [Novosphingobium sp.]
MRFGKFAKALGPVIAVALAAGVAGCDGTVTFNGEEGKALSELDLSGKAPEELVLAGPDEVRVTTGDKLAITVEGDPEVRDQVRFVLKDGSLAIHRKDKSVGSGGKVAIINVTMPAPREVVMAGSGKITTAALASKAEVTVAGSGTVESTAVSGESLGLTIAGSGNFRAAGAVKSLDMTIAGSGSAQMDTLKVDKADVTIAGSGSTAFSSDGEVEASIAGSGNVTVKGRARCTVSSMGSGKLVCEGPVQESGKDAAEPPAPPQPPAPPEAPKS